jgi:hypothetical protein
MIIDRFYIIINGLYCPIFSFIEKTKKYHYCYFRQPPDATRHSSSMRQRADTLPFQVAWSAYGAMPI